MGELLDRLQVGIRRSDASPVPPEFRQADFDAVGDNVTNEGELAAGDQIRRHLHRLGNSPRGCVLRFEMRLEVLQVFRKGRRPMVRVLVANAGPPEFGVPFQAGKLLTLACRQRESLAA